MANAQSLNLTVRTPMISATSSSSRIASHDRPTRLRSRFRTARTMRTMTVSPSQKYGLASRTLNRGVPPYSPGGRARPPNPRSPRRNGALSAEIRMISANPSVTIAR